MRSALILGAGYTGGRLASAIKKKYPQAKVTETHRSDFDLSREETWKNLPQVERTFWTFPAQPVELVRQFLDSHSNNLGLVVVIGTTSSFRTDKEEEIIKESSPLLLSEPRVQGEEEICKRGGICVRAAGIYGAARNPIEWVRNGLVGPSEKFVNFIHIEDLINILIAAAEKGSRGASYIAADSQPYRWRNLIRIFQENYDLKEVNGPPSKRPSKIVDATKTLHELSLKLKFASVEEGVKSLKL